MELFSGLGPCSRRYDSAAKAQEFATVVQECAVLDSGARLTTFIQRSRGRALAWENEALDRVI